MELLADLLQVFKDISRLRVSGLTNRSANGPAIIDTALTSRVLFFCNQLRLYITRTAFAETVWHRDCAEYT